MLCKLSCAGGGGRTGGGFLQENPHGLEPLSKELGGESRRFSCLFARPKKVAFLFGRVAGNFVPLEKGEGSSQGGRAALCRVMQNSSIRPGCFTRCETSSTICENGAVIVCSVSTLRSTRRQQVSEGMQGCWCAVKE